MPVYPLRPAYKHLSLNSLRFLQFHGMEEVVGSIPIRSTNPQNIAEIFTPLSLWQRIPGAPPLPSAPSYASLTN
jgi:hypothetical protein